MTKRLTPYGLEKYDHAVSMVGKSKTVKRLVARMPLPEIMAKVGGDAGNAGYASFSLNRTHRVVRKNARPA